MRNFDFRSLVYAFIFVPLVGIYMDEFFVIDFQTLAGDNLSCVTGCVAGKGGHFKLHRELNQGQGLL